MTVADAHIAVLTHVDKVGSGRNRTTPPNVVDDRLTEATNVLVDYFLDDEPGAEATMKHRDVLATLYREGDLAVANRKATLSPDLRNLFGGATAQAKDCPVELAVDFCRVEEWPRLRGNAFRRTDIRRRRCLVLRRGSELEVDRGELVSSLSVTYLTEVPQVYLGTYNRPGQTIGNPAGLSLPEGYHDLVVRVAAVGIATALGDESAARAVSMLLAGSGVDIGRKLLQRGRAPGGQRRGR